MRLEVQLHLAGGDVLAAADDDVLEPPDDREPAVVVEHPEVARPEPAPVGRGRRLRRIGVAGEQLGAPQPDLAPLPPSATPERDRVGDADLDVARRAAVGLLRPLALVLAHGAGRRRGGDGRRLGRAVGALHDGPERPGGLLHERGRDAAGAARHQPDRRHPLGGETRRAHEAHEERRGADHERDPLALDDRQTGLGRPPLHAHGLHGDRLRQQDPVQQPRHVGERRRHHDGVVGGEPVQAPHQPALVRQAPVGVQHRLGRPRRPAREQDGRHVGGPGR